MTDAPQAITYHVPAFIMSLDNKGVERTIGELAVEFKWTASDTYAVSLKFAYEGEDEVTWVAAVDLFTKALDSHVSDDWHGVGHFSLQIPTENVCRIMLTGDPERPPIVVKMPAVGLVEFFERIRQLRRQHADYIRWLINKELNEIISEEA